MLDEDTCVTHYLISNLKLLCNAGDQTHSTFALSWPSSLTVMRGMRCFRAHSSIQPVLKYRSACTKDMSVHLSRLWGLNSHSIQMCVTAERNGKWMWSESLEDRIIALSRGYFSRTLWCSSCSRLKHKVSLKFSDQKTYNSIQSSHLSSNVSEKWLISDLSSYYKRQKDKNSTL